MDAPRVALLESAAAFRRGLEPALAAAGLKVETPDDVIGWAGGGARRVAVLTSEAPTSCELSERVVDAGGGVVVLLPDPTPAAFHHALAHGAVAAVDRNADPDEIAAVVAAAARGQSLLPGSVVTRLAERGPAHAPAVSPEEATWLSALAGGSSVVDLADEAGYSERSMFRRLHELYARLGASNRDGAVVAAQKLGLLEPGD